MARTSIPHFSLPHALQFCAPVANPDASPSSPFSQLPEEPRALAQDLQPAGGMSDISIPQHAAASPCPPALPAPPLT